MSGESDQSVRVVVAEDAVFGEGRSGDDPAVREAADGPVRASDTSGVADARSSDGNEAALIIAIAEGRDRAAFTALFEAVAPKIKGYLMAMGVAGAEAETISLEAMVAIWRRAGEFDQRRTGAYGWIYAISRDARTMIGARAGTTPRLRPLSPALRLFGRRDR